MKVVKILSLLIIIVICLFMFNREKSKAISDCLFIEDYKEIYYEIGADEPNYLDGVTINNTCGTTLGLEDIIVNDRYVNLDKIGSYPVYFYLDDEEGNSTEARIFVHVEYDRTKPEFTFLPDKYSIEKDSDLSESLFLEDIQVLDNKDPNLKVTVDYSKINVSIVGSYSKSVIYTVVDDDDNKNIEEIDVEVVESNDTILDKSTCEVEVHSSDVDWSTCVSLKNEVQNNLQITYIDNAVKLNEIGDYIVRYVVKNKSADTTPYIVYAGSFDVKVDDTTKPVIEVEDQTITVFSDITDFDAYLSPFIKVTDNYDGEINNFLITQDIKIDVIGDYAVKVDATDSRGNVASKTFTVHVVDNEPPTITINEGKNILMYSIGDTIPEFINNISATDRYDGVVVNITVFDDDVNYEKYGIYPIIYKAVDKSGNASYASSYIIVMDENKPEFETENVVFTVYKSGEKPDYLAGIKASDPEMGDITSRVFVDDSLVNYDKEGIYPLTYVVWDLAGNIETETVDVQVLIDSEKPTIEGAKDIIVEYGSNVDYKQGVTAKDNVDTNVILNVITDDVNLNELGTYTIIYQAIDFSGNKTEVSKQVTVVDTTLPKISGVKDRTTKVGKKIDLLKNVRVVDNYDGEIDDIEIIGDYNLKKEGKYKLTIKATDSSGNISTEEFVLTVEKNNTLVIILVSTVATVGLIGAAVGLYILNKEKFTKKNTEENNNTNEE